MSHNIRSQVSLEAIMLVSILFFGATMLTAASYFKTTGYSKEMIGQRATQVLNKIAERINTVFFEGDGFSSSLFLENNLLGEGYNVSFSGNLIFMEFNGNVISRTIVPTNVTGTLSKGDNWVSNQDGVIVIS